MGFVSSASDRAGRRPWRTGRGRALAYARRHWLRLLSVAILLVVVVASVAGVAVVADWDGFPLGLLVGLVGGVLMSAACWFIVEGSGARSYAIGSVAESWTADALARLGPEWRLVHSVPIGDHFDIDHVPIGPPGVFAVETKFTTSPWDFNADRIGRG